MSTGPSEGEAVASRQATRLLRDRSWLTYAAAPAIPGVAAMIYAVRGGPVWMALGIAVTTLSVYTSILAFYRAPVTMEAGRVEVDAGELRWNGARWLARSAIRQVAWRIDPKRGALVHIEAKGKQEVRVAMASAEDARALVEELGHGVAARAATFKVLSRAFATDQARRASAVVLALGLPIALSLLIGASRGGVRAALGLTAFVASLIALLTWHIAPTRVEVGPRGISIGWLGRRRFVAFTEVASLERTERRDGSRTFVGVDIVRTDGSVESVVVTTEEFEDDRELLLARIEQAREGERR